MSERVCPNCGKEMAIDVANCPCGFVSLEDVQMPAPEIVRAAVQQPAAVQHLDEDDDLPPFPWKTDPELEPAAGVEAQADADVRPATGHEVQPRAAAEARPAPAVTPPASPVDDNTTTVEPCGLDTRTTDPTANPAERLASRTGPRPQRPVTKVPEMSMNPTTATPTPPPTEPKATDTQSTRPNAALLMDCPSCGARISKRARLCPKCSAPPYAHCQVCATTILVNSASCPECGDPDPFHAPEV